MSVWFAIGVITLCAVCWDFGVVLQKQAADRLPELRFDRHVFKVLRAFLGSGRWLGGLVISSVGWGLFAWALVFTPISLARAIQGSGFVILAGFSLVFLNHRLTWREWVGVCIVTLGIAGIGLSEVGEPPALSSVHPVPLLLASSLLLGSCSLGWTVRRWFGRGLSWLAVFSAFAGVLLGLGDVFTKGLLLQLEQGPVVKAVAAFGPLLVAAYLPGVMVLTRAYQHGRAIAVTAVSDFCARVTAIVAGVWGLGEGFPVGSSAFAMRVAGLGMVLFGTVLLSRFSSEHLMRAQPATVGGQAPPV